MTTLHIAPAHVTMQVHGPPKLSTTLLKGFTTSFTAYVLHPEGHPEGGTPMPLSGVWWEKSSDSEGDIEFLSPQDQPRVEVKGTRPGVVRLQASLGNSPFKNTVEITVDESDLLLYAPDGYVYRVPKEAWAHNTEFWAQHKELTNPRHLVPGQVVRYDRKHLPQDVENLLANEVMVANIPLTINPNTLDPNLTKSPDTTSPEVGFECMAIWCFLLNLNSILLSYTQPSRATQPQPADDQKP
jgi:hypothetical protein